MAANWVQLPSGRAVNLGMAVSTSGLRFSPNLYGEPIPEIEIITPGGGMADEHGVLTVPATYAVTDDDALAIWQWARTMPRIVVDDETRAAMEALRGEYKGGGRRTTAPTPADLKRIDWRTLPPAFTPCRQCDSQMTVVLPDGSVGCNACGAQTAAPQSGDDVLDDTPF